MRGYMYLILLITVVYGTAIPEPLDKRTVNLNILDVEKDSEDTFDGYAKYSNYRRGPRYDASKPGRFGRYGIGYHGKRAHTRYGGKKYNNEHSGKRNYHRYGSKRDHPRNSGKRVTTPAPTTTATPAKTTPGTYSGYKVLAVTPHNPQQVKTIAEFQRNQSLSLVMDWWTRPRGAGIPVMAAVTPGQVQSVIAMLEESGLAVNVTMQDLQEAIDEESTYRISALSLRAGGWNPNIYHNLDEIQSHIKQLVAQQPTVLSTEVLGTTQEGRNIEVVKVVKKGDNRPVIWIDCGIHSREWVTQATCLHILDKLVTEQNNTDKKVSMLATFDFYILPVTNPDGYAFSWASDRMWRKNRRPINGASQQKTRQMFGGIGNGSIFAAKCTHGVDPNRNFNISFKGEGSSDDPCDDRYRGSVAFSEAESLAIKTGLEGLQQKYGKERVVAYVTIHAYGQKWMAPFAYKKEKPKDHENHMKLMEKALAAVKSVNGIQYTHGPISEVIDNLASGSSTDWVYEKLGIKNAFALELRDTSGFLLPQDQIKPTATETWEGLKAMSLEIAKQRSI